MIKNFTIVLNLFKKVNLFVFLFIWVFIGLETQLWWQNHSYIAAVSTALVGYSMLLYVLPELSANSKFKVN